MRTRRKLCRTTLQAATASNCLGSSATFAGILHGLGEKCSCDGSCEATAVKNSLAGMPGLRLFFRLWGQNLIGATAQKEGITEGLLIVETDVIFHDCLNCFGIKLRRRGRCGLLRISGGGKWGCNKRGFIPKPPGPLFRVLFFSLAPFGFQNIGQGVWNKPSILTPLKTLGNSGRTHGDTIRVPCPMPHVRTLFPTRRLGLHLSNSNAT